MKTGYELGLLCSNDVDVVFGITDERRTEICKIVQHAWIDANMLADLLNVVARKMENERELVLATLIVSTRTKSYGENEEAE